MRAASLINKQVERELWGNNMSGLSKLVVPAVEVRAGDWVDSVKKIESRLHDWAMTESWLSHDCELNKPIIWNFWYFTKKELVIIILLSKLNILLQNKYTKKWIHYNNYHNKYEKIIKRKKTKWFLIVCWRKKKWKNI